jgi:hypothetical protein
MDLPDYRIRAEREAALWYCLMTQRTQQHSKHEAHSSATHEAGYYQFILSHTKFNVFVNALAVVGAVLGIYFVWQASPPASVWVFAVILFLGLLSLWGFQQKSAISLFVIGGLAYLAASHLPDFNALIPGDDPTPPNACTGHIAPNDRLIIVGRQAIATGNDGPQNILTEGDHILLKIDVTTRTLFVSADVYDSQGLVLRIDRNRVKVSPTTFPPERPNRHTLRAFDHWGNTILSVRFINKTTIKIAGHFWFPGHQLFVFPDILGEAEPQPISGPLCFKIEKGSHVGSVLLF